MDEAVTQRDVAHNQRSEDRTKSEWRPISWIKYTLGKLLLWQTEHSWVQAAFNIFNFRDCVDACYLDVAHIYLLLFLNEVTSKKKKITKAFQFLYRVFFNLFSTLMLCLFISFSSFFLTQNSPLYFQRGGKWANADLCVSSGEEIEREKKMSSHQKQNLDDFLTCKKSLHVFVMWYLVFLSPFPMCVLMWQQSCKLHSTNGTIQFLLKLITVWTFHVNYLLTHIYRS